jgi:hypothetical protein
MRGKRILVVFMGLLLVGSMATVSHAALGVDKPGKVCKDTGLGELVGQDTCVTCLNKGKGNAPTCICKVLAVLGYDGSHGQCVKAIKQALN